MMRSVLCALFLAGVAPLTAADELTQALDAVQERAQAGRYPQALKSLDAARKELQQRHTQKLAGFLPDEVAGFRAAPARLAPGGASRAYRKGELMIEATLEEFSATQKAMLDMAQWGMRMGAQMLSESLSFEGCPANLESRPGQDTAAMTIELAGNARLRLELRGSSDGAVLKSFAGRLKLGELDRYLRGE